jgi:hypothetical protein
MRITKIADKPRPSKGKKEQSPSYAEQIRDMARKGELFGPRQPPTPPPTPEQEAESALQTALDSLDKVTTVTPEIERLNGLMNQKVYMKTFFPKG